MGLKICDFGRTMYQPKQETDDLRLCKYLPY